MYKKKGRRFGEKNHAWKGESVKYRALHHWVESRRGKPNQCERCGTSSAKRYDWANISGEYKRDLKDWIRLCRSCHQTIDGSNKGRKFRDRPRNKLGQFIKKS